MDYGEATIGIQNIGISSEEHQVYNLANKCASILMYVKIWGQCEALNRGFKFYMIMYEKHLSNSSQEHG